MSETTTGYNIHPAIHNISYEMRDGIMLTAAQWVEIDRDKRMARIEQKLDELLTLLKAKP